MKSKETNKDTDGLSREQFYRKQLPQSCIDFRSPEGKLVFSEALGSGHMECFFKLISQFRTQDEIAYCGITSLVMALNALEVDPGRIWKGPWRWYHESMLDCCTPLEVAQKKGINMSQFVCLAKCNGLHPFAVLGSNITALDLLREEVKRVTKREDLVLIASYSRRMLGQTGDGHFSPIAGYHEGRDMVLILDTARFKYPPHWIKLQALWDAMKTIDLETGKSRGYVLLSIAKDQIMPLLFRPSCELSVDLKKGSLPPEVLNFYKEWKGWLNSEGFSPDNPQGDVIGHCIQHLLTMIAEGYFKKGPLCLSMPFSMCFAGDSKIESFVIDCEKLHISARKVIYALKSLFVEMESTKTFKSVKRFLLTKNKADNELFLRMVQCRSESSSGADGSSSCESECCLQPSESTGETLQSMTSKKFEELACCGGHGCDSGSPKAASTNRSSADILSECETGCETKFSFKFHCRPEHIATVFLFVWPHENLSQKDTKSCYSCKIPRVSENPVVASESATPSLGKDTKENPNSHEQSRLSSQTTTLAAALTDLLHLDLEEVKGTYFKGEIKALMVKFREVLQYHCYHE